MDSKHRGSGNVGNRRAGNAADGRATGLGPMFWAAAIVMALFLASGMTSRAQALTCADVGGVDTAGNCTLSVAFVSHVDFTLTIPGNLVMANGGSLTCNDPMSPGGGSACNITVSVGGD